MHENGNSVEDEKSAGGMREEAVLKDISITEFDRHIATHDFKF